ncbi:xanthine dehydrogenase accessory protein XdhC [Amylibacter sp.]|nr:xanthine dehydrogenase accessory protein XdhC [Amylibacter sp.]MDC0604430.1 xanthine dehydrogenase accessory protein XdhC [Amylibacter sp.]
MTKYFNGFNNFLNYNKRIIQASIVRTIGSSPRNSDTEMFISETDTLGTIGGGQLEYLVINHSKKMLAENIKKDILKISLGPEIGQCCGGKVEVSLLEMYEKDKCLALNRFDKKDKNLPHVYVMGAGHVGRALALQLQHLPVRCVLIDSRVDELAKCSADVETRLSAIPEEDIKSAPRGSAYVILTHDHALDFILCGAALDRHDAKYVGMIGSKTKKVKFKKWYQVNDDNNLIRDFICPIGNVKNQDKRPSIIASSVTAEVINMLFANVNLSEQYDLNLNKVAI